MGYCRVCGSEAGIEYRASKRQSLCGPCAAETPRKASRAAFERRYWGAGVGSVSRSMRDSFWADYLTSVCTLADYIESTTEYVGD